MLWISLYMRRIPMISTINQNLNGFPITPWVNTIGLQESQQRLN